MPAIVVFLIFVVCLVIAIPVSISLSVVSVLPGASVSDLFLAGIIPGILIGALLMVYSIYYCKKHGEDEEKKKKLVRKLKEKGFGNVMKESALALLSPVIIFGCIYSGIASPTEAAVISVFYALTVSMAVYRSIKLGDIKASL